MRGGLRRAGSGWGRAGSPGCGVVGAGRAVPRAPGKPRSCQPSCRLGRAPSQAPGGGPCSRRGAGRRWLGAQFPRDPGKPQSRQLSCRLGRAPQPGSGRGPVQSPGCRPSVAGVRAVGGWARSSPRPRGSRSPVGRHARLAAPPAGFRAGGPCSRRGAGRRWLGTQFPATPGSRSPVSCHVPWPRPEELRFRRLSYRRGAAPRAQWGAVRQAVRWPTSFQLSIAGSP